jgi:hypothetical protein
MPSPNNALPPLLPHKLWRIRWGTSPAHFSVHHPSQTHATRNPRCRKPPPIRANSASIPAIEVAPCTLGSWSEMIIFSCIRPFGARFWFAKNAPLLITAIICLSTFHLVHQYAVHITEGPSLMSKRFKNIAHVFTQDFFVTILSRVFHRSLN